MKNYEYISSYPCPPSSTSSYMEPYNNSYINPYGNSCITPSTNLCTNPCMPSYTDSCVNYCNNYCNNYCSNYCNNCCCNNPNLPNIDIPPTSNGVIDGEKGPFKWHIEYYIDESDITKDYFVIQVSFLGVQIINTRLDINNPKININLTISGVGLIAELGVDFTKRIIYFKGNIDLYYYKKAFDFIIYKF